MKINKCVCCGYCCTVSACSYGTYDHVKKQCVFLTSDNKCFQYDAIVESEKDYSFPMLGCGCSSTIGNERRNAKIRELGLTKEQIELDFGVEKG